MVVPTVAMLMLVKPSTARVTSTPIAHSMLAMAVANTTGITYGRCSSNMIFSGLIPENTAWRVNSRWRRPIAMERIRRASNGQPRQAISSARLMVLRRSPSTKKNTSRTGNRGSVTNTSLTTIRTRSTTPPT